MHQGKNTRARRSKQTSYCTRYFSERDRYGSLEVFRHLLGLACDLVTVRLHSLVHTPCAFTTGGIPLTNHHFPSTRLSDRLFQASLRAYFATTTLRHNRVAPTLRDTSLNSIAQKPEPWPSQRMRRLFLSSLSMMVRFSCKQTDKSIHTDPVQSPIFPQR